MSNPQAQFKRFYEATRAVADAIEELGSVPSGELYAHVMDLLSLREYEFIIDLLVDGKLIKKSNNLLIWDA